MNATEGDVAMRRGWGTAWAVLALVALVGSVAWVGRDFTVTGDVRPSTAANVLGVDWVTATATSEPAPAPQPTDGGGLGVDWQTRPGAGTQGGGGSGLAIDWAGRTALSEQVLILAYEQAFGRDPSPAELKSEVDRQSWDQSVRSLPDLLKAHRAYLRTHTREQEATVQRALAAAPGEAALIAHSDLLYGEMVRRLTIHDSYLTAFGRRPTAAEEQGWPDEPVLGDLIARHRESLKQDQALRQAVIDLAYQTVWHRTPVAGEQAAWDRQAGATYTEILAAIDQQTDPILPERPVITRHDSRFRSHAGPAGTTVYFQQAGDRAESFRMLRQNPVSEDWMAVGSVPAGAAGQEIAYTDQLQVERAVYKVCAVNQYGETCSAAYATTDKPNQVRIEAARADSPTLIRIAWYQVGNDVTAMAVKRQKPDGGWEEAAREHAVTGGSYHDYFEPVKPATKRTYMVCAYNSHGETCTPWLFVESPLPTPVAPADFRVTARNQTDWLITWRPQSKDMVRLQRFNPASRQWDLLAELRPDQTQYLRQELIGDPDYAYRLCAFTGYNEACTQSIIVGKQFDHPTNFTSLDYGVYWFRCGTCRGSTKEGDEGTQSDGVKAVPGLSKEYFDPAKPTVIYVHGWARNSVKEFGRESAKSPTDKQDLMATWKAAGYNVGIFYWNAFADDDWGAEPRFAEGKIDKGDITWSVADGRGGSSFAPTRVKEAASALFAQSIIAAMQEYKGPEFRIVGHSLGTQMAVMATYYISRSPYASLTPQRVALIDPWISSSTRAAGLGSLIDQVKQSRGTVYEYYQTSVISQEHGAFGARAVTNRVHPMYIDWANPGGAHAAAIHWYFNSLSWVGRAPTASMPLEQLRPLMDCGCRFEQDGGKETTSVMDDTFVRYQK
jgi:hypothetical protein